MKYLVILFDTSIYLNKQLFEYKMWNYIILEKKKHDCHIDEMADLFKLYVWCGCKVNLE